MHQRNALFDSKMTVCLQERNSQMFEYVNQQFNQKTPNIIKAHHYLVVNYLNILSNKNHQPIQSNNKQATTQQIQNSQVTRYTDRSGLTQSVALKPSPLYQTSEERKPISFPSVFKLELQTIAKRSIRLSSFDTAGSNQLQAKKGHERRHQSIEVPQVHIFDRYQKKTQRSEELSRNPFQTDGTAEVRRARLQRTGLLCRQNSKSQSNKHFKTLKENSLVISLEDSNQVEADPLIIDLKQKSIDDYKRGYFSLRRQKKLTKRVTLQEKISGDEPKGCPCPWENIEERDYLMEQETFNSPRQ